MYTTKIMPFEWRRRPPASVGQFQVDAVVREWAFDWGEGDALETQHFRAQSPLRRSRCQGRYQNRTNRGRECVPRTIAKCPRQE